MLSIDECFPHKRRYLLFPFYYTKDFWTPNEDDTVLIICIWIPVCLLLRDYRCKHPYLSQKRKRSLSLCALKSPSIGIPRLSSSLPYKTRAPTITTFGCGLEGTFRVECSEYKRVLRQNVCRECRRFSISLPSHTGILLSSARSAVTAGSDILAAPRPFYYLVWNRFVKLWESFP